MEGRGARTMVEVTHGNAVGLADAGLNCGTF